MVRFDKKRHIKDEKFITPMNFVEHIRTSDVSENRPSLNVLLNW